MIKTGALADGVPRRDLYVSPLHAMYLDGMLFKACDLVNGLSIVALSEVERVEYIHIELDEHDVIFAEGAAAESFVDDNSRGMFQNAAEHAVLYPGAVRVPARYCAPLITEGAELERVLFQLRARARVMGAVRGYVDEVAAHRVSGWAQDANAPENPVWVEVLVDGVVVAQALANLYRPDLAAGGLGSGRHCFVALMPRLLTVREQARVEVRRSGGARVLPRAA